MGDRSAGNLDTAIVGRDPQLRLLAELLDDAGLRGGTRMLSGEPGIGKTAMLGWAADEARRRGMSILSTRGTHAERHLPFAALHRLVRPLLSGMHALTLGHQQVIATAFGMSDGGDPPERFFIALAVLELITDAAARQPLLLVVDDMQWVDAASVEAIEFVGRRLASEPAVMLIATRGGAEGADPALPHIALSALDPAASLTLLHRGGADLPEALTERVLHDAAGNPLALIELPTALRGHAAGLTAGDDIPLTARLERAFASRLMELDEQTRTLLLLIAIQDGDELPSAVRAATMLLGREVGTDALRPAITAELVATDEQTVSFRHPLVRSAVRQSATDRQRRAAHAVLARCLADDADRSASHRASATAGPDEAVATILDEAADRALRRGAATSAENWLERAAQLSGDDRRRAVRLLRAGELAFELGRFDDVQRLIGLTRSLAMESPERARLAWLEGVFDDGDPGDADGVRRLVDSAAHAREDGNVDLAVLLLMGAGRRCWWGALAPVLSADVLAVAEGLGLEDGDPRLMNIRALAGTFTRGNGVLAGLQWWAAQQMTDPMVAALLGVTSFVLGDFDRALFFCGQAMEGLRRQGRLAVLAQILILQMWAAVLLGRWDVAHVAADEAYRLALETRQSGWVAIARLGQANLAALRGSAAKALELVVDVERTALLTGSTALLNGVAMTRGMAELGQDRPDAAFHHFRRMMDPADPAYHPVERLWQIDYLADAAAGSGHVDEARQVLAGMEPVVAAMPSPGMRRAVAYARAVLADDDMVEQRIAEALSLSVPLSPWYRARVHLAHGLWLRRQRRVAESRESLRAAHEVFSALGAQAWITRARRELQATGVNVQDVTGPGWARLTAQELQIAQLAAAGLSNRDIAQRLYLSHRTVGSHLYRLYPKLGVTSRGQLHAKLPVPQN